MSIVPLAHQFEAVHDGVTSISTFKCFVGEQEESGMPNAVGVQAAWRV